MHSKGSVKKILIQNYFEYRNHFESNDFIKNSIKEKKYDNISLYFEVFFTKINASIYVK
jgi:hypothetical protein